MTTEISRSKRLKQRGFYLFLGGLALTFGTLILANSGGGGIYLVAWGPVLFGPVVYLRGVMIEGTAADITEADEPAPINPALNKCPTCNANFSAELTYCKVCGRYLKL